MRRLTPSTRNSFLPAAIVIGVALVAYGNSLSGPFVFDDLPAIVNNPTIRHLSPPGDAFHPPADGSGVTGRPLVNLTFALNYAWSGLDTWSYHVVNLAIHVLAGLALFGLIRRTLLRPVLRDRFAGSATLLATVSAAWWTVHPLQTESVTFVIQRTESLMGLCYLATLYFFCAGTDSPRPRAAALWAAVACCMLGMAAKEVMVTAPVLVLLYDRTFVAGGFAAALRTRWKFYLALSASWLVLLWLLLGGGGTRGSGAGLGLGVSWWSYALKQCEAIVLYLRLAVWPHPLVVDYGAGLVTDFRSVALQATVVLLLVAGTVVALWRRPALGFLGAWFFIILAPSSSFVPLIGQTMAEHRMYLPLGALVVGAVLGISALPRNVALCVLLPLILASVGLTAQRNKDYQSASALWTDTVRQQPDNYRAHYNLAVELGRTPDRRAEAITEYETAIRLEPRYAEAQNNLGVELAAIPGREDEALSHYEAALRLRPDYADAHYNLAVVLGRRPERAADAVSHYEAALRLRPSDPQAENNLAVELAAMSGRLPEAIAHYESALHLQPDYPEAHFGLANALAASPGRLTDAVTHYDEALRLRPGYDAARYFLAATLAQIPGRSAEAIRQYEVVLRNQPNHVLAHYNLGNELAKDPATLPQAASHLEAAARLKPDFVGARNNLAGAYFRMGRIDDAIAQLTEVLRLDPANQNARRNLEMLRHQRGTW